MSINISNTQGNLSQIFESRRTELTALLVVFSFASVTGVVLSTVLFLTILSKPQLRTGSGILIAHHQILHVLQTGISNPFFIVTGWVVWLGSIDISGINCTVQFFFCQLIIYAETWASLFLAVNRFVALIFPHNYGRISSRAATTVWVITPWCLSVALNVPATLGIGSLFGMRQFDCGYVRVSSPPVFTAVGTLGVYLPEGLQGMLYTMIIVIHYCWQPNNQATAVQRKRFVLFLLLFGSYAWYMVSYLPYLIVLYGFPRFWFADKIRAGWFIVVQQIGYAGSPVFLLCMNKNLISSVKEGIIRAFHRTTSASVAPRSKEPTSFSLALSRHRS